MRPLAPLCLFIMSTLCVAVATTGCKDADEAKTGEAAAAAEGSEAPAKTPDAPAGEAAPDPTAAPAKAPGHPMWPGVDLAGELKRLEGTWHVKTGFGRGEPDTWAVKGDAVTITKADGKTELGTLKFEMPGRIGVKVGDMTSFYAYARDGDTTWIGLGTGGAKAGESLYVAASRGLVTFDGKSCRYHDRKMSFGGAVEFKDPVEVKCSVQAADDKAVFNYQVPRFMKEGEFDEKSVDIIGEALANDQLRSNHEVKPATAAPAEGVEKAAEGAPAKPE